MAIVHNKRKQQSWLKPFMQKENAIAALRDMVDHGNTVTRGGMYCLEIINQLIQNGAQIFERIPQEVFSGLPKGGRRNVQAAALLRANDGAVPAQQGEILESGYTREQEIIGSWAEKDGCWTDAPDADLTAKGYTHNPSIDGSEAQVYFDARHQWVHKTIDHIRYRDLSRFIDRINIHNAVFPETPMAIVGWGVRDYADDNTGFCAIVRQPFVKGTAPTEEQIAQSMQERGLSVPAAGAGFFFASESNDILVTDVHDNNAVLDKDGHVIVFDCEAMVNEIKGFGGTYNIPELDYDPEAVLAIKGTIRSLEPGRMAIEDINWENFEDPERVRNELLCFGRTLRAEKRDTWFDMVYQLDPENKDMVLVSNTEQLSMMLRMHDGRTDEGDILDRRQLEELAQGKTVRKGKRIYYFNLDKGRIDSFPKGNRLYLKPEASEKENQQKQMKL